MFFADETRALKCKLAGAVSTANLPLVGCWTELSFVGAVTESGVIHTATNGTAEITLIAVSGASEVRKLQGLGTYNADDADVTLIVYNDDGADERALLRVTLDPGDHLTIHDDGSWEVKTSAGAAKGAGGGGGTTDHAALTSNLAWTTSGHTGTADRVAIFSGAGAAAEEAFTGTGSFARATSPTLVTPALGTPASGTLTNCTGLPTAGLVNDAVTYAKMQNVSATSRVLGRKTASAGDPEECTLSEVLDFIGSAAQGDILYRGAAAWARLGAGTSGHYLQTQGAGANPQWAASAAGGAYRPVFPTGRLTTDSGVYIPTTDRSTVSTIFYTAGVCPIYDGTDWSASMHAELSIVLDSDSGHTGYHQSGKNFDAFVCNDGGTIRLGTGPAWSSDTARGTGAGTTELQKLNGIWTNAVSISLRFGTASGNTVSVAANRATYIGTFRTFGATYTQVKFGGLAAGGDEGWIGVWNCYNRVPWRSFVGETTDSWAYTTATIRPANNSTTMRVSYVAGLDEGLVHAQYPFFFLTTGSSPRAGIGYDSTTAFTTPQQMGLPTGSGPWPDPTLVRSPGLGFHYLQALERGNTGVTFYGDAGGPTIDQNGLTSWGWF